MEGSYVSENKNVTRNSEIQQKPFLTINESKDSKDDLKSMTSSGSEINDNQSSTIEIKKPLNKLLISRSKRMWCYIVLLITNTLTNLDHGTIPGATDEIQKSLNIDEKKLGAFGSFVYLGIAAGALLLTVLINKLNRKLMVVIGFFASACLILTFTFSTNLPFLFVNRFFVGFFQSFISVYIPVWIDQFAPNNNKTLMMAFFQLSSPLGLLIGFGMTYFVKQIADWTVSFIIQASISFAVCFLYICQSNTLFSHTYHRITNNPRIPISNADNSVASTNANSETIIEGDLSDDNISYFAETFHESKASYFKDIGKLIFDQPVYLLSSISTTCLLFVSTALTFWAPDYLGKEVMQFDESSVTIAFIIICLTAPASGVILGGHIVQKFCGGYEGKHSITFCMIQLFFGGIFVVPVYFLNSLWSISLMLWMILFFGGSTIPILQGITISALPHHLRASGNSLYNMIIFILGFTSAPFFYGAMFDAYGETNKRLPFCITIGMSFVGLIFCIICSCFRYRNFRNPESQENINLKISEKDFCKEDLKEKNIELVNITDLNDSIIASGNLD